MNEILISLVYTLIITGITVLGYVTKSYFIPWIKQIMEKNNVVINQTHLDIAKQIIEVLVQSAYRLQLTGKIEDAKNYVFENATTQLKEIGIELNDDMIDEIRRAALIEWESFMVEIEDQLVANLGSRVNYSGEKNLLNG